MLVVGAPLSGGQNVDQAWVTRSSAAADPREVGEVFLDDGMTHAKAAGSTTVPRESANQCFAAEYGDQSDFLWYRRYSSRSGGISDAMELTLDISGQVCVSGHSSGSEPDTTIVVDEQSTVAADWKVDGDLNPKAVAFLSTATERPTGRMRSAQGASSCAARF